MMERDGDPAYRICPAVDEAALNALFATAWEDHRTSAFGPILQRSLVYVCAYAGTELIGFVYLAWDGGVHAFLLNPTVHPRWQRRGIGTQLVREAVAVARQAGVEWVHVDYEPHLRAFYAACGFASTEAGILRPRGVEST
jgi:GNAT superfamily N-acetyltransferase